MTTGQVTMRTSDGREVVIPTQPVMMRRCGRRKQGGIYAVAPADFAGCCRGAIPLRSCGSCYAPATRPFRGVRRMAARVVLAALERAGMKRPCERGEATPSCPLALTSLAAADRPLWAAWIGAQFYATPEEFLDEAREQGVSRRVRSLPRGWQDGDWLLLIHPRGVPMQGAEAIDENERREAEGLPPLRPGARYWPAIIAAVKPSWEYVVADDDDADTTARAIEQGMRPVRDLYPDGTGALPRGQR